MGLVRALGAAAIMGFMAHSAFAQAVPQQDEEFAQKAAEGGLMEVQFGQLAQQQAKDEQVVQFGQRMVQDHGQANEKLISIAEQKALQLPRELPGDMQQKYDEMQQLSGAEFDQAYMDEMVEDHEKDIKLFEQQAEGGKDPDLRAFAEETLPTLRAHLELAKQVQSQIAATREDASLQKHAALVRAEERAG
jgi:putative membrane protein